MFFGYSLSILLVFLLFFALSIYSAYLFCYVLDIDECSGDHDVCPDVNAHCSNTEGSYTCVCNSGYTGDGRTCSGIWSAYFRKSFFLLFAFTGFETFLELKGRNLFPDIDECSSGVHDCSANAQCTNDGGSYTCSCQLGYHGDGRTCSGIFIIEETHRKS